MEPDPRRYAPVLSLVALIPAVIFLVDRGENVVALSLVSVAVIAGSLYYMLSPAESLGGALEGGSEGPL